MLSRTLAAPIALALTLLPASAAGQTSRPARAPTRAPVTIALVERLPQPGASFVVLRRPSTTPHDMILLPATADAGLLSEAVQMLLVARQAGGDTATEGGTLRFRPQQERGSPRRVFPWAQRVLSDLRRAAPRQIEGAGTVAAVEIWLPRQAQRAGRR